MHRSANERLCALSAASLDRLARSRLGRALGRLRRQRRDSSVARIDNERRSPGRDDGRPAIPPRGVVADGKVGLGVAVAAVRVVSFPHLLFIFRRFFLREEFFPRKLKRAFERRDWRVGPDALQIRLAVECT